jgi:hypothetical protein
MAPGPPTGFDFERSRISLITAAGLLEQRQLAIRWHAEGRCRER